MAKREISNGDLRSPVVFYSSTVEEGLDGRDMAFEKVFSTFADVYNPSLKDLEISKSKGVKASLTLVIRDPLTAYVPKNQHFVEILDLRYAGQKWEILDIRPRFDERSFLTIVLGGGSHG
ncbi:phage head-tail adapter protein [Streptococcus suis]|nr:phage head-tail adapter protein [Streptococcus suis]MBY5039419.1 phage head-tail adapter protein [Streptococcus suis]HEL1612376.1 phage head-tail adapter protein [Streptococcus suis]